MKSESSFLDDLLARGVTISAAEGEFKIKAPAGVMTPDLLERVRAAKPGLLGILAETNLQGWHDYFEERAAISEYDGGLSKVQAEKHTFDQCVEEWIRLELSACEYDALNRLWTIGIRYEIQGSD